MPEISDTLDAWYVPSKYLESVVISVLGFLAASEMQNVWTLDLSRKVLGFPGLSTIPLKR